MSEIVLERSTFKAETFSGKKKDWTKWSMKFKTRAHLIGYVKVMMGEYVIPPDDLDLDLTTSEGKMDHSVRAANQVAFNDLLSACMDDVSFGAVAQAVTEDLPYGDSSLAWTNLASRYEACTSANIVALKREFLNCKMENDMDDPELWITELERRRTQLMLFGASHKIIISDLDIMMHVLNYLPTSIYESGIEAMEYQLGDKKNPLTIVEMKVRISARYQRYKSTQEPAKEAALLTQFKGRCRSCGKVGHKQAKCPDNKRKKYQNFGALCKVILVWSIVQIHDFIIVHSGDYLNGVIL